MKKRGMTGGGTAGHVTPNIALMPALKAVSYTHLSLSICERLINTSLLS